jgi:hypothetical protein
MAAGSQPGGADHRQQHEYARTSDGNEEAGTADHFMLPEKASAAAERMYNARAPIGYSPQILLGPTQRLLLWPTEKRAPPGALWVARCSLCSAASKTAQVVC